MENEETYLRNCRDCVFRKTIKVSPGDIKRAERIKCIDIDGEKYLSDKPGAYSYCSKGYWDGLANARLLDRRYIYFRIRSIFTEHGDLCADFRAKKVGSPGTCSFCTKPAEDEDFKTPQDSNRMCKEHIDRFNRKSKLLRRQAVRKKKALKRKKIQANTERRLEKKTEFQKRYNKAISTFARAMGAKKKWL